MDQSKEFVALLNRHFSPVAPLRADQAERLAGHYALMVRWNKVLNLTSITMQEEVVVRHYCESLFLAAQLPFTPQSLMDLGSGAGFPGIPIAITRPDWSVFLAESHQRKAVFLREATRDLANVRVGAVRAEEVSEHFDWLVSRAVRPSEVLKLAMRRSNHLALLVGTEDAEAIHSSSAVRWRAPVRLPWGRQRVLLIGDVV